MQPEEQTPTQPGESLRNEFLEPLGVTQKAFAKHIGVPIQRVNEIVRGRRGVSPATAWLFAGALGTTADFWMTLQTQHDLAVHRPDRSVHRIKRSA